MGNRKYLFLAGLNLGLLHMWLLRELASLRYCTEMVLLFLLVAFFLGQTFGFATYRNWSRKALFIGLVWAALPLPVLMGFRLWAGHLRGGQESTHFYPAVLFFLASITAVYAVLLPKAVDAGGEDEHTLAASYSAELVGSLVGLFLGGVMIGLNFNPLLTLYPCCLLGLAYLCEFPRQKLLLLAFVAVVSSIAFTLLNRWSMESYYQRARGLQVRPSLLFARNSKYQRVDVLKAGDEKILFLNGVEFFSNGALDQFNFYLSELPARLSHPKEVLVIGSGSMSAVGRMEPYTNRVTTVELDPVVVQASQSHFQDEHPGSDFPHEIVYDDARHFLRTTDRTFDMIVLDIPTAFTLQTGTLFTKDFFRLAKGRLREGGFLSLFLTEPVRENGDHEVAGPILAAVEAEFEQFLLLTAFDVSNSFVYAGDHLPFTRFDVDQLLGRSGLYQQHLFETDVGHREAERWLPASLSNLSHVWAHQ